MSTEKDKQVQELFKVVQTRKAEIAKAEKPNWITNCSFGYNKDSSSRVNIQVCSEAIELITMVAHLINAKNSFDEAQEILGTKIQFNWMGYTFNDWVTDIQTRINKIEITKKKKELEILETRLNGLISKEMRDQMELDEITKLLAK